jgi:predicted ATPase
VAALAIQDRLQKEDWWEVGEIRVRIALHTGESELRGDDYYGPAVNRCARIRAAGHGGQVLVSQVTRKLIQDQVAADIRIEDLGRHRLKDLLDAERIFQVSAPGLLHDFPPLKTLDLVRHNLPVQLSSFVGREIEIAEVRQALFSKRLVTLAGTGGSGKTRLALQVGAEAVDQYPDGVWFIDLVAVTDGKQIGQEIASQLKLPPESNEALERQFEDWNALLILDNCEQIVVEAAKLVNRLLKACPGLTFLATSREQLGIAGELVYRTPPLAFDLGSDLVSLETVAQLDATKLLLERARDRGQGDLLREDSAPWIAKLCKRLDGIPLAIEQAAANLDVLTPKQLLAKLDHHFSMRGLEDEGVPDRHRTLEATIDWSYQMLSEKERLFFERLSIFVGGWSLDGARAVCQGDGILEREVDDLLGSLIRKSMVASSQTAWEDRRFRLLEVVREYALEKTGDDPSLEERHHSYFNGLAQESLVQLTGPNQALWAHLLEAEHENLRKAIRWAQEHNCSAEMAVALRRFWMRMGFLREGLQMLRYAIENEPVDPISEANAFNALGAFSYRLEHLDEAILYYELSLEKWQRLDRQDQVAAVLHNLALVAIQARNEGLAIDYLDRSIEIHRSSKLPRGLANAQMSSGTLTLQLGNLTAAESYLRSAKEGFAKSGDEASMAIASSTLADVLWQTGRSREAVDLMSSALRVWLNIPDPCAACVGLICLAEHVESKKGCFLVLAAKRLLAEVGATLEDHSLRRLEKFEVECDSKIDRKDLQRITVDAEQADLAKTINQALAALEGVG